ncbi:hypothetical protein NDU88_007026 [Pleurodeles waltl]|uniref:Uncharacterized protein n=1 Tax=Pleurodeles waltl TaxID=8319 RepID=A0AAV7MGQ9_PLEWA|nr:hypothetical protein NDU88_007026 [Pleurodeles waltl]
MCRYSVVNAADFAVRERRKERWSRAGLRLHRGWREAARISWEVETVPQLRPQRRQRGEDFGRQGLGHGAGGD